MYHFLGVRFPVEYHSQGHAVIVSVGTILPDTTSQYIVKLVFLRDPDVPNMRPSFGAIQYTHVLIDQEPRTRLKCS